MARVVQHRPANAPAQCDYCGLIWYGYGWHFKHEPETVYIPVDVTLCLACGHRLEAHLYRKHTRLMMRADIETNADVRLQLHTATRQWIAGRHQATQVKPRFRHVQKWMRNAVRAGLVRPNSLEIYLIYSRNNEIIKVAVMAASDPGYVAKR